VTARQVRPAASLSPDVEWDAVALEELAHGAGAGGGGPVAEALHAELFEEQLCGAVVAVSQHGVDQVPDRWAVDGGDLGGASRGGAGDR